MPIKTDTLQEEDADGNAFDEILYDAQCMKSMFSLLAKSTT